MFRSCSHCSNHEAGSCGYWWPRGLERLHNGMKPFSGRRGDYVGPGLKEDVNHICIVSKGTARIVTVRRDGTETLIAFVRRGEIGVLRNADVGGIYAVALEDFRMCVFDPKEFLRNAELAGFPDWLHRAHLRQLQMAQIRTALLDIAQADDRLAGFLLFEGQHFQQAQTELVRLPYSRDEIGAYLHLSSATVSRSFTRLEAKGMIACVSPRCFRRSDHRAWERISNFVDS